MSSFSGIDSGDDGTSDSSQLISRPSSASAAAGSRSTTDNIMRALQNLAKRNRPSRIKRAKLVARLELARSKALEEKQRENRATWVGRWSAERIQAQANFDRLMITQPGYHVPVRKILSHVQDSKQRAILSNMSQLWADILKPYGTTFLFREVVPILRKKNYIGREEMRAIRYTCREWRDSLDTYLRSHYTNGHYSSKLKWPPVAITRRDVLDLTFPPLPYDPEQFTVWSDRLLDESENPFITGKLFLVLEPDWLEDPEFDSRLRRLLARWRSKLHHVTVLLIGFGLCGMYETLCDYLALVPHTKFLIVGSVREELPSWGIPSIIRERMLAEYGARLESLTANPQGSDYSQEYPSPSRDESTFPRLKIFKFTCDAAYFAEEDSSPNWPVEELDCKLKNVEVNSVPNIFRLLGNFWRTLRKLTLTLEREIEDGVVVKLDKGTHQKLRLDLPRVEEFILSVSGINLGTMDFILPMEGLRLLDVTYVKYVEDFGMRPATATPASVSGQQRQPTHIIQYGDQLQESNIWALFPLLRKVTHNTILKLKPEVQLQENLEELRERYPAVKIDVCRGEWGTSRWRIYTREQYKQYCDGTLQRVDALQSN